MAETDKCAVSQNSSALTCDVEEAVEAAADDSGGELGAACAAAHMTTAVMNVAHATKYVSMRRALILV
jgi:hypothetical protein